MADQTSHQIQNILVSLLDYSILSTYHPDEPNSFALSDALFVSSRISSMAFLQGKYQE